MHKTPNEITETEIKGSYKTIKKVIRKLIGWYVDPLVTKQEIAITNLTDKQMCLEQLNRKFKEEIKNIELVNVELAKRNEKIQSELLKRIEDIEGREEWTRERFDNQLRRIEDIEGREEWTRERFDNQLRRIEDIEGREEWTRERFADQLRRIEDIEGREEWTRERLADQLRRIEDIEGREEWVRKRFDEQENITNKIVEDAHKDLNDNFYDKKSYAQSGEDTISAYIINFLGIPMHEVTYLDLGANHAKNMSNSYYFYQKGARGVLVEANPELIPELEKYRQGDLILNKAVALDEKEAVEFYSLSGDGLSTISYESAQNACQVNPEIYIKQKYTIPTITINELLKSYFQNGPTILSIDLEGIEEKILEQMDFNQHRPLIIILENIPYRPYLVIEMKQDKVLKLMQQNDYIEYAFTGINSIYVDKKYIEKFNQHKTIESN